MTAILCRLGIHRWHAVEFLFAGWLECRHCHRRRV